MRATDELPHIHANSYGAIEKMQAKYEDDGKNWFFDNNSIPNRECFYLGK